MRTRLITLYVGFVAATLVGQAQSPERSAQPTFRGGVNYVRVDMNASRDGTPVTDLRVEEIDLLEDGVPQNIEAFEHVQIPSGGPEATRIEPNSIRAGQQMAADPRARVFVIFLDTYHVDMDAARLAGPPLVRFLNEALGPDDLVGLMTSAMSPSDLQFGRKTTVLSSLVEDGAFPRWVADHPMNHPDPDEELYLQCFQGEGGQIIARRREKLTLDALGALTQHLSELRDERKAVLLITGGWGIFNGSPLATDPRKVQLPPPAPIGLPSSRRGGDDSTEAALRARCERHRLELGALNHSDRLREITDAANRGNVTFYPISAGLSTSTSPPGASVGNARVENRTEFDRNGALRGLAEDTDGLSIVNTNNIAEPMRRIIADTSSYYLLGYQSTNAKLDGRFRSIKVSVKRPNVQVRARRGYRAALAAEVRAAAAASSTAARLRPDEAITRAFNSVLGVVTPMPVRLRTSAWTRTAAAGSEGMFWVVGELDATTRKEPGWAAGSRAEVVVLGSATQVPSRSVDLAGGTVAFAVRVPDAGHLAPGQYDVRISLRAGGVGGTTLREIARVTVPTAGSPLGEAVLLRRGPASGTSYVETADPRFRRNERLRLELPTSSTAVAEARVVDRAGMTVQVPTQVTTRPDPSGGFQWVVVDATIAPFAAGDYAVAVTQEGAVQVTGFRVVP